MSRRGALAFSMRTRRVRWLTGEVGGQAQWVWTPFVIKGEALDMHSNLPRETEEWTESIDLVTSALTNGWTSKVRIASLHQSRILRVLEASSPSRVVILSTWRNKLSFRNNSKFLRNQNETCWERATHRGSTLLSIGVQKYRPIFLVNFTLFINLQH